MHSLAPVKYHRQVKKELQLFIILKGGTGRKLDKEGFTSILVFNKFIIYLIVDMIKGLLLVKFNPINEKVMHSI
jgi:hypothetical protein